jgi:cell division protein FtsZ
VKGISDLINIRGLINLDFADIRTVMQAKGMAIMGSGLASGENRAVEAATQAISSPLLENICIDGATGIIINVTGGLDLTLWEVNEASTLITEAAHPDAEIIFGAVIDETLGDAVSVTVIATGFGTEASKMASDEMHKLHAMTESQLMNAGMQRLNQELKPSNQAYENISLSEPLHMEAPMPPVQPMMAAPQLPPQPSPASVSAPQMQFQAPQGATNPPHPMQFNTTPPQPNRERPLPREALLAKARAYRESQATRDVSQPEQLSMNMEDAPARLTPDSSRSPFESDSLEVPSYLRRKRGLGADNSDGVE